MSEQNAPFDLWFREVFGKGTGLSLRINKVLHHETSPFQDIHIMETQDYGRMMTLDGCVMFTDRDEFVYHEMISHVPLCTHPNPKTVLVIGGGDGGAVREILKHPSVTHVDLVEIDEAVVRLSEEYFPDIACAIRDPRVSLRVEDGIAFAGKNRGAYDVILIDSTDYVGMAEGLSHVSFFNHIKGSLKKGGILVMQSEDAWFFETEQARLYTNLLKVFGKQVRTYMAGIPTYVSGTWTFAMVSPYDPLTKFDSERAKEIGRQTQYYNEDLHKGCFALPNFIRQKTLDIDKAPKKKSGKKMKPAQKIK